MIIPLSKLPEDRPATVVALAGGRGFQERIVSMGLHIGSEVRIAQGASGGAGPLRVAAGETRLAIGHGMADKVMVAVDPE